MHHIDRRTPWEEIWQAMELLVQQGKVIYVGSSNFAGWNITVAQCAAAARHFMGLVSEQSLYNLSTRTIELEVFPACWHYLATKTVGIPDPPLAIMVISEVDSGMPPDLPKTPNFQDEDGAEGWVL